MWPSTTSRRCRTTPSPQPPTVSARFVRPVLPATLPGTDDEAAEQAEPHVERARSHLREVLDRVADQRDEAAARQAALLAEEEVLRKQVATERDEIERLKVPTRSD